MDFTNKMEKNAAFGAFAKIEEAEVKTEEKTVETTTEVVKAVPPVSEERSALAQGLPEWDLVPPVSVIGRR